MPSLIGYRLVVWGLVPAGGSIGFRFIFPHELQKRVKVHQFDFIAHRSLEFLRDRQVPTGRFENGTEDVKMMSWVPGLLANGAGGISRGAVEIRAHRQVRHILVSPGIVLLVSHDSIRRKLRVGRQPCGGQLRRVAINDESRQGEVPLLKKGQTMLLPGRQPRRQAGETPGRRQVARIQITGARVTRHEPIVGGAPFPRPSQAQREALAEIRIERPGVPNLTPYLLK